MGKLKNISILDALFYVLIGFWFDLFAVKMMPELSILLSPFLMFLVAISIIFISVYIILKALKCLGVKI